MNEVPIKLSEALKASQTSNGSLGNRKPISAADIRAEFLHEGVHVVREVLKQARGQVYDMTIDQKLRDEVFQAMLPIINNAGDHVHLENLATQSPEERANSILHAVSTGVLSPKQGIELVEMMKKMAEMTGQIGTEGDNSKLIINLAPTQLDNMDDVTLEHQVKAEKDAIKQIT